VTVDALAPALRLLDAVVAEFGAAAPDRRYLAPGPLAAWDGEHLAVSCTQVLPGTSDSSGRAGGLPAHQAGAMQLPRAVYEARVLRCFPTVDDSGHPPTGAAIQAASETILADLGLLLAGVYRFLGASPQGVATAGQAEPLGPEGGLAGYRVVVTYSPLI
jgi:hypothetical protein